jgi:uncharacterized membrane protein YedE/YeeE
MGTRNNKTKLNTTSIKQIGKNIQFDVKQLIGAGVVAVILISMIIAQLITNGNGSGSGQGGNLSLYIVQGFMFGYILQRSMYGFAGAFIKPIKKKDYGLSKSVVLFLTISTICITFGQVISNSSTLVVSHTMNFMFILGGLLFGIGMVMAGGCASGTLQDAGDGFARGVIAIIG